MGDVRVESTQWHTYQDTEYDVGAQYDTDEQTAASLVAQGKAKRVEGTAAPAKTPARKTKAAPAQPDAPVTRSTAVEPMTTNAAPIVQPKGRPSAAPRAPRRPDVLRVPRVKAKATRRGKR